MMVICCVFSHRFVLLCLSRGLGRSGVDVGAVKDEVVADQVAAARDDVGGAKDVDAAFFVV
jgi:hypothetical protein